MPRRKQSTPTGSASHPASGALRGLPQMSVQGQSRQEPSHAHLGEGREGVREPAFAIAYLEDALDRIYAHILTAQEADELMRLARALSVCTTALFNAHRISAILTGESGTLDEALKALGELEFGED